ncbi:TIGR03915 family putative DNA repair protein [Empedobacter falsenii]
MERYVFDNSFEGFLTLIFDYYVRKPQQIKIVSQRDFLPSMFDDEYIVITDEQKAERVHKSLKNKLNSTSYKALQAVFLSEEKEAFEKLFHYCCLIINESAAIQLNYGNEFVLYVMKMYRSVHREKHHHEAFIRFEKINQDLFFAKTEPKYNILPLIIHHFRKRYADQNWIIYDSIRKYGIYYDKNSKQVHQIQLNFTPKSTTLPTEYIDVDENLYQELWKSYFHSTTIETRKNSKLQMQLMPKRFWKNLTEYN